MDVPPCTGELCHWQQHEKTECCATMPSRQTYVASNNKMYLGLHVKGQTILSGFN
jgi:hypothetical protein